MFDWTDEQALLIKTVGDFSRGELAPRAAEVDEKEGWNADAFRKMATLGLLGITADETYGGAGLGCLEASVVMEELARACARPPYPIWRTRCSS